jgi:hypothetical protein
MKIGELFGLTNHTLGTVTIDGVKNMEDELRKECKENSDRHSSCYITVDIAPHGVEEVYRGSLE